MPSVNRSVLALASLVTLLSACSAPVERTIVYDARHGDSTSMDVFLPNDGQVHPTVVFYHGGAWKLFHKERFRSVGRRLVAAGYAAVSVEYRLVPEGKFPNAVRDGACALAYVQNHAAELGVDASRIAVMGYSAGAQIGGLLAVDPQNPGFTADCAEGPPSAPQAMISVAGPMDMFLLAEVSALEDYLGGTPATASMVYALASPISHVTPDDPPFLFIHGSRDLIVPVENATEMRDALEQVGVSTSFLEMRGSGHIVNYPDDSASLAVITPFDSLEAWIAIIDFLHQTIGKP